MKGYITGLNGCSCHPFNNWEECEKAHKQSFNEGDPVRQRHTGMECVIHATSPDGHNDFVIVKYGDLESDKVQEHVAMLIKLEACA